MVVQTHREASALSTDLHPGAGANRATSKRQCTGPEPTEEAGA